MDTAITRMMKLNATLLVLGFCGLTYLSSLANYWGYVAWFSICAFLTAGGFTLIWVIAYQEMCEVLGKQQRSEITNKNIVGSSVAFVTLLMNCCFIAAFLSAAVKGAFEPAGWISFLALLAYLAMTTLWAASDVSFVKTEKKAS